MDVAENTILDWYNVSDQKVHVYFFLCGHHTRFIYFSFGSLVHVCKSRRLIKGLTGLKESQLCHKSHFDSSDSLCDRHSVNTHFIISRPWPTWTSKKGVSSPTNTHTHTNIHSFDPDKMNWPWRKSSGYITPLLFLPYPIPPPSFPIFPLRTGSGWGQRKEGEDGEMEDVKYGRRRSSSCPLMRCLAPSINQYRQI